MDSKKTKFALSVSPSTILPCISEQNEIMKANEENLKHILQKITQIKEKGRNTSRKQGNNLPSSATTWPYTLILQLIWYDDIPKLAKIIMVIHKKEVRLDGLGSFIWNSTMKGLFALV